MWLLLLYTTITMSTSSMHDMVVIMAIIDNSDFTITTTKYPDF